MLNRLIDRIASKIADRVTAAPIAIKVRPGDVILVKVQDRVSADTAELIVQQFKRVFPENKTIVLGGEMDLHVFEKCPETSSSLHELASHYSNPSRPLVG